MEFNRVLLVLAIFVGCAACDDDQIENFIYQMRDGESNLVTMGRRYALASPLLSKHNWATISVNGNHLLALSEDCSRHETTFEDLSEEQRDSLGKAMEPFEQGDGTWADLRLVANFARNDQQVGFRKNFKLKTTRLGKFVMRTVGESNFSIGSQHLEDKYGIIRIFFVENTVTFVYADGRIKMQPKNCLTEEDKLTFRAISLDRKDTILKEGMEGIFEDIERVKDLTEM